jgi:hypothetical protein
MRTAVRRGWGQEAGLPRAVSNQLVERIRLPISPPPDKNSGKAVSKLKVDASIKIVE